jgi:carbon monoxide dehydrogenase subunit G
MNLEHEFTVPVPVDEAWKVLLDVERIAPCMPGATLLSVDGRDFTGSVKVKVGPITVTYQGKATFAEMDESARRVVITATGNETRGSGTASATVTAVLQDRGPATGVRVDTDLNVTGRPAQFGRGVMAEVGAKLVKQFATCLADELGGQSAALVAPGQPLAAEPVAEAAAPETERAVRKATAKKAAPAKNGPAKNGPAKKTSPAATTSPAKKATAARKTAAAKVAAASTTSTDGLPRPTPAAATPPRVPRPPAEPIDLLDVAGGSVAKRVAPVAAVLVLLFLLTRHRRHRHRHR